MGLFDGQDLRGKWKTALCCHPCEVSWLVLMSLNVSLIVQWKVLVSPSGPFLHCTSLVAWLSSPRPYIFLLL
ncbi:hypothetical protein VNO80_30590 [Phaseolus coccineus]|uniref:Uncharacterized protein n=1 Tax=Phaseolus coccineus TaxID=3886 RepID=A0AAN9LDG8_PHACN